MLQGFDRLQTSVDSSDPAHNQNFMMLYSALSLYMCCQSLLQQIWKLIIIVVLNGKFCDFWQAIGSVITMLTQDGSVITIPPTESLLSSAEAHSVTVVSEDGTEGQVCRPLAIGNLRSKQMYLCLCLTSASPSLIFWQLFQPLFKKTISLNLCWPFVSNCLLQQSINWSYELYLCFCFFLFSPDDCYDARIYIFQEHTGWVFSASNYTSGYF